MCLPRNPHDPPCAGDIAVLFKIVERTCLQAFERRDTQRRPECIRRLSWDEVYLQRVHQVKAPPLPFATLREGVKNIMMPNPFL